MSNERQRRHFSGQEKMTILRRHLVDKVPVSQLCEENRIQPTQLYGWQKVLFEQGAAVFDGPKGLRGNGRSGDSSAKRIAALEAKLQNKNEVVAELLEDHVRLKKELGDL
jgi:transposase-like protein